jgi:hypothetical protein
MLYLEVIVVNELIEENVLEIDIDKEKSDEGEQSETIEKNNVFYSCKKIFVDPSKAKFNGDLAIVKSMPEKYALKPKTYYITLERRNIYELIYCTSNLKEMRFDGFNDFSAISDELGIAFQNLDSNIHDEELHDKIEKKFHALILNKYHYLNYGYEIGAMGSNCGGKLYSSGFGPCHAVVALLESGEHVMYHAYSAFSCNSLDNFIEIIRDDVVAVYVFYNSSNKKNFNNAPYLATSIASELYPKKVLVNTVFLNQYTCIAFNNGKIILGEEYLKKIFKSKWLETTDKKECSLDESNSIEESIRLVLKNNNYKYKKVKDKKNNEAIKILALALTIPTELIINTAKYMLEKESTNMSNITSYSPTLYKKELSLKKSIDVIKKIDAPPPKKSSCCVIL